MSEKVGNLGRGVGILAGCLCFCFCVLVGLIRRVDPYVLLQRAAVCAVIVGVVFWFSFLVAGSVFSRPGKKEGRVP